MCGEQMSRAIWVATSSGSPPRVRGTAQLRPWCYAKEGSPPRVRGTACGAKPGRRLKGDHPRVCGEQPCTYVLGCAGKGSPPRVRGTDNSTMEENLYRRITPACAGNRALFGRVGKEDTRITPACAGNSTGDSTKQKPEQDHPRVCGEQLAAPSVGEPSSGSPPRVRGTAPGQIVSLYTGITPACAGNSSAVEVTGSAQ